MAVPIVDGIDWNNFEYRPVYSSVHHRGIFEWGFLYKESQVPQQELDTRQHNSEPYRYCDQRPPVQTSQKRGGLKRMVFGERLITVICCLKKVYLFKKKKWPSQRVGT